MSVFHQKPYKGLLKIPVVVDGRGCMHKEVMKYCCKKTSITWTEDTVLLMTATYACA